MKKTIIIALVAILLTSCGQTPSSLDKTYTGDYFSIGYDSSMKLKQIADGVLITGGDSLILMVQPFPIKGLVSGDISALDLQVEKEIISLVDPTTNEVKKVQKVINGLQAIWIETKPRDEARVDFNVIIPIKEVAIHMTTDGPVSQKDQPLVREIIESFKITNEEFFIQMPTESQVKLSENFKNWFIGFKYPENWEVKTNISPSMVYLLPKDVNLDDIRGINIQVVENINKFTPSQYCDKFIVDNVYKRDTLKFGSNEFEASFRDTAGFHAVDLVIVKGENIIILTISTDIGPVEKAILNSIELLSGKPQ